MFLKNIKTVPNCALCKWRSEKETLNLRSGGMTKYPHCSAQADKPLETVYGNNFCKQLYEPKEE